MHDKAACALSNKGKSIQHNYPIKENQFLTNLEIPFRRFTL